MKKLSLLLAGLMFAAAPTGAADLKIAVPVLSGLFDATADGRAAAALRASLQECGWDAKLVSERWGQHWHAYETDKSYDAVAVVWDNAGITGFASDDFIHQKNGVAFLESANLKIETVADLKGLRLLGFGGATQMFPELVPVLPTLASYWEAPSGFSTTQALVNGEADAFITDGLIFAIDYVDRARQTGAVYGDEHWPRMKFVGLFKENGDRLTFRKESVRDRFNTCLAAAQKSGAIAAATKPYVDPYRDIVGDQIPAY